MTAVGKTMLTLTGLSLGEDFNDELGCIRQAAAPSMIYTVFRPAQSKIPVRGEAWPIGVPTRKLRAA